MSTLQNSRGNYVHLYIKLIVSGGTPDSETACLKLFRSVRVAIDAGRLLHRPVTYIRVTGHFIFQPYRYVMVCVR